MIEAHGGQLVQRHFSESEKKKLLARQLEVPTIKLNTELVKDVHNLADGVYSPLEGFLREEDFKRVVNEMRLADGTVWPIPIILDVSQKQQAELKKQSEILLTTKDEEPLAILSKPEFYQYDREELAEKVYGTTDQKHPGVAEVYKLKEYLVGGEIKQLSNGRGLFSDYNYTPAQTRQIFKDRGWETVTAFQTRNVPHRGHEFLQMQALARTDGLFIQPVIGAKKLQDFKDEYIVGAYDILVKHYYPTQRVLLGILPLKMRYAGPREAILHALIRKNYGCTHFIIGRDHAGAGDYYPPYAAQEIFEDFSDDELEIKILKFDEVVYLPDEKIHEFTHQANDKKQIHFTGTKLRKLIEQRQELPSYLIRPEIYNLLVKSENTLIDSDYCQRNADDRGFVLWFTGLSQSGKTTIADEVYQQLKERKIVVERLDGDIIRQSISSDLSFTKEDRDENIDRVGFVAQLLSKNGVGVVASFISPYRAKRSELRQKVDNFVEIYVNTPLDVCELRDEKGLYTKARAGEIKNFTGISDPYEEPEEPEIELKPAEDPLEVSVEKVMMYLKQDNWLK